MKNNLKALMLVVALGFSATAIAGQPEEAQEEDMEVVEGQPSTFDKVLAFMPALTPVAIVIGLIVTGNKIQAGLKSLASARPQTDAERAAETTERVIGQQWKDATNRASVKVGITLEELSNMIILAKTDVTDAGTDDAKKAVAEGKLARLSAVKAVYEKKLAFARSSISADDAVVQAALQSGTAKAKEIVEAHEKLAKAKAEFVIAQASSDLNSADVTKKSAAENQVRTTKCELDKAVNEVKKAEKN